MDHCTAWRVVGVDCICVCLVHATPKTIFTGHRCNVFYFIEYWSFNVGANWFEKHL